MRISDWSADVCSSDLVPNGSIRDIAGQWMAGSPAYDPAAITIPTMVIVGAADTDTPPALAREVIDRLGTDERIFAEVPGGTHFTVFEPARDDQFRTAAGFLDAETTSKGAISNTEEQTPELQSI